MYKLKIIHIVKKLSNLSWLYVMKSFGNSVNLSESHYRQIEKTWNSDEPSQECPANQHYSMSTSATHQGGQKRTQTNI